MTALPSFVELMASLGIDSDRPDIKDSPAHAHHSRSSSYSSTSSVLSRGSASNLPHSQGSPSPSILISRHPSSSSLNRDGDAERRRSRSRYSPYSPSISHMRRGSVPTLSAGEIEGQQQPSRALSTSPVPNLTTRSVGRRSSALGLGGSNRRPEKLSLVDGDFIANTPISTFVRRKTPQSSPISPTFPHRKRSTSPSAPVLIPQLPTFIFPQLPTISGGSSPSSDSEDDPMDAPLPRVVRRRLHHSKLSVKQLRASRRSDSNISLGRSTQLDPAPMDVQRLTSVA
ncbi:hypothetical protein BXZ70DRAFT_1004486 [Cristinia sonorae]|uniref:Uncharacterized protein n=1 Tax=Cristinia sonorae TaxID=1940300 RepID=A0A8K0UXT9_9AGAR|nr:hypothetical protein BXZ70DRAFT_1004486 [Cristinia sonorae]